MSLLSPLLRSRRRSLVARLKLQTGVPCGVYRISGSRPRLPTMMILLKDIIEPPSNQAAKRRERQSSAAVIGNSSDASDRVAPNSEPSKQTNRAEGYFLASCLLRTRRVF